MAVVAQLVERQIVALNVAGSSPVDRPSIKTLEMIDFKGFFIGTRAICKIKSIGESPLSSLTAQFFMKKHSEQVWYCLFFCKYECCHIVVYEESGLCKHQVIGSKQDYCGMML